MIPVDQRPAYAYTTLSEDEDWEVVELCGRFHLVRRDKPARTGQKRTFWTEPGDPPQHRGGNTAFVVPAQREATALNRR